MQIHASHTLGGLLGVVIVLDVDHEAAQQIANTITHFRLKGLKLTRKDVISDVVVGQERDISCLQASADLSRNGLHDACRCLLLAATEILAGNRKS